MLTSLSLSAQDIKRSSHADHDRPHEKLAVSVSEIGGLLLPILGVAATAIKLEKTQMLDAAFALGSTMYSTNIYKKWVFEERPSVERTSYIFDLPKGGGRGSFPSKHASMSFCGAALVHKAFGWKVAAPCYLLATSVGISRIYINRHYIHDVVAGAFLGAKTAFSSGKWFDSLTWVPTPLDDGGVVNYTFTF